MNQDAIFTLLTQHCCEVLPELSSHRFQPTDQLKNLGANSIDRAEILSMIMESLSLKIPRVELSGVQNLGELTCLLHEKLKTKGKTE